MTDERIISVELEDEMKTSYLDYSMSVIVGRALPDARDGLKPVHRRVLYAMREMGLASNKPYRKAAGVVGEVLKSFHPHGDVAVYDTIVRLAQDFSCRYPLIDGQGNFGSLDGDPPAAMRYTEVRLTALAEEMLADIDKETVDFVPSYDESTEEPTLLPSKIPQLLINGSSGIAVGMATNIPPHNICEVVDSLNAMIANPQITIDELMKHIKGPDFPTGGYILGTKGIQDAYRTGRGSIIMQAKARIEKGKGEKQKIVVTEIPYQVNKANLVGYIADLVRDKKIEGISDIRDESDREGLRVVIEVKRDDNAEVLLNQLLHHTQLKTTFGIIMLSLVDRKPLVLNLRQMLSTYIEFRKDVITRRTKFELRKAEKRAHILEGLKIALKFIDKVIKIIKSSKSTDAARISLIKEFKLSLEQVNAILDMRLHQLTALEQEKLDNELKELLKAIEKYRAILAKEALVFEIMREEFNEIKKRFGDARRTEILKEEPKDVNIEDLIKEEDMVVTLSHSGYIKRLPVSTYRAQQRGGKGVTGTGVSEEDFVEDLFVTTTHNYILFFTNSGKVYWLKVYEIPEAGRYAKGKPIVNLVNIAGGEKITATIPVKTFDKDTFLVMATKQGLLKKTALVEYSNPRASGIIAIKLKKDDELVGVKMATDKDELLLATYQGKAIRFACKQVREIGRTGQGVFGIRIRKGDFVVGIEVVKKGATLLTVTTKGFGKRSDLAAYRVQSRGGKGITNLKATARNGFVVGIKEVTEEDELMIITTKGTVIRTSVKAIRSTGRSTQGVRLIKLDEKDEVSAIARLASKEE